MTLKPVCYPAVDSERRVPGSGGEEAGKRPGAGGPSCHTGVETEAQRRQLGPRRTGGGRVDVQNQV